jgi:hypothetical protein
MGELEPCSTRVNPVAPSPPCGTPSIVQRLYRISLIKISTRIWPEDVPTVSTLGEHDMIQFYHVLN